MKLAHLEVSHSSEMIRQFLTTSVRSRRAGTPLPRFSRSNVVNQRGQLRVVSETRNRTVSDFIDHLIDHEERNKKPLARDNGISETVLNLDIKTRWVKYPVDQLFQLRAADVVQFVSGDHFDICHQKRRLEPRTRDALSDVLICHADLM